MPLVDLRRAAARGTRRQILGGVFTLLLAGLLWVSPADAADKVALVIGNNAYRRGGALSNAVNDARAVAEALKRRGFDLGPGESGLVLDADKATLEGALRAFRLRSQGARLAVIYFSGHGMQIDNLNFLLPVDARLEDLGDVDLETVRLDVALGQMRGGVNALILDACRNNPFGDRLARSAKRLHRAYGADRGMAPIDSRALSGGSVVALAAAAGEVAADGDGRNSPYAAALVHVLDNPPPENPRLDLRKLFAAVREDVEKTTNGTQRPEAVDRLPSRDVFVLSPPSLPPLSGPNPGDDRWMGVEAGKTYRLPVLDNDRAANGGALRVASVDPVSVGRAEVTADGQGITYTAPTDGTAEEVRFRYRLREQGGGEAEGSVSLALVRPPKPTLNPPDSMIVLEGRYPEPGSVFKDCEDCPEMVVLPAGRFQMGSPLDEPGRYDNEGPQHWVTISQPFAVGRYEVTQAEWKAVMWSNSSAFRGPRNPVDTVSWKDAQAFIDSLNTKSFALSGVSGGGAKGPYRLLSESEWEYAARAGRETAYSWGDTIGRDKANCDGCGSKWDDKQTAPVGSFKPNNYGLYDMHGNVWEWVEDCWNDSYEGAPGDGRAWTAGECNYRVLRGSSWLNAPRTLRSASRYNIAANFQNYYFGFRVARTISP